MALPPFDGAVQLTVADAFPAAADTLPGAAGTAGGAWLPDLNTTVASSQMGFAPVPALADGVAPALTTWSSVRSSMSLVLEMLVLTVYPDPAVRLSPNPESE